jgi:uncharacterized membrane protein YfcA
LTATVQHLKVFDLTTTVPTMTLTGIAADLRQHDRFAIVRRVLAALAMLAGAIAGAALVLQVSDAAALGLAAALLTIVAVGAMAASLRLTSRSPPPSRSAKRTAAHVRVSAGSSSGGSWYWPNPMRSWHPRS